ncbi:MAG: hypothetical protein PHV12_02670 [Bacteroidales bacterium]|jgi:hypothetical protein|nr:hypothetical protein [Bacteroidales bacterium]MDD3273807.1 hypothetical protein [Bacteroidales bacterium]MDD4057268.1 hypothetical protein [Bacteroidales bacterium]
MMEFITVPLTFGIGAYAFYKVIELFVRKKERLMLVDKLNTLDNVNTNNINLSGLFGETKTLQNQFLTLRIGSLLMGLGLGLLVGYLIVHISFGGFRDVTWDIRQTQSVIYGASTLLFGGMGLIAGFVTEMKMKNKK